MITSPSCMVYLELDFRSGARMEIIPHFNKAWWRSGNAAVCKTAMRGFDSRPRLNVR